MAETGSYWTKFTLSRRKVLRSAAAAGAGVAAISLIGCGGGDDKGGGTNVGKADTSIDPTQGKPGGTLITQSSAYPPGFNVVTSTNTSQFGGYAHASLVQFRHGKASGGVSTTDLTIDPEVAQALPERPDELSYTFKLKPANFHNGRAMTSEDVKYSVELYRDATLSGFKSVFSAFDKVETPDPRTVTIKTKAPFADTLVALVNYNFFILAREHQESDAVNTSYMGLGPYKYVDTQSPIQTRFRKNADYFDKPYPYFDELIILGVSDDAKRIADFTTGQTNSSYGFRPEQLPQIRAARPQAKEWPVFFGSHSVHMRTDQAPYTDKRVRQALSMAVDRAKIREGTSAGEGTDADQYLSYVQEAWGLRKPKDLPQAKYWVYNPQEAMAMLRAAGVTLPIKGDFSHWNGTVIGQTFTDTATLAATNWRALGIADYKQTEFTFAQAATTYGIGNYNDIMMQPSGIANTPNFGLNVKSQFFYDPVAGIKVGTSNLGYIMDKPLSDLSEKQLTQFKVDERKATFKQMEESIAENMYKIPFSTYLSSYFTDEKLKNAQIPKYHFSGSRSYQRYWWWDK